jgi:DNA invertase Pin-like site-specific DNA recombinase
VVTKLDRLARSLPDARDILDELTRRNVKLSLSGSIHDPTDPVGRLLFNVLAMVAEFEADLIRLRTREGMQVAKAKGRLRGKQTTRVVLYVAGLIGPNPSTKDAELIASGSASTECATWISFGSRSSSTLTIQAKHLLELHDLGTYTQAELAELFGVGRSTIYRTLDRVRPAAPEPERPFAHVNESERRARSQLTA